MEQSTADESSRDTARGPLEIAFVGDVMFGQYDERGLDRNPEEGIAAFDAVRELFDADLAVANLETPLLRAPPSRCPWDPRLRFAAGAWAADELRRAGIDVVSLANNHVYDMRTVGARDTAAILRERGIVPVGELGAEDPPFRVVSLERSGWRIAFVGFTRYRNSLPLSTFLPQPYIESDEQVAPTIAPLITAARGDHDLVIALAHWGLERRDRPLGSRREASRALIDAGADVVIGHHPHALQGIERYAGGIIAHSLGDFLFDSMLHQSRLSGVLRLRFSTSAPIAAELAPVALTVVGSGPRRSIVPVPARGHLRRAVQQRVKSLSAEIGARWASGGADGTLMLD